MILLQVYFTQHMVDKMNCCTSVRSLIFMNSPQHLADNRQKKTKEGRVKQRLAQNEILSCRDTVAVRLGRENEARVMRASLTVTATKAEVRAKLDDDLTES